MSSFAPGFAGRIAAAENMLHRAFGDSEAFAPVAVGNIGRRMCAGGRARPAPLRARRPHHQSDPGMEPVRARDPVGHGPFVDPIAQAHNRRLRGRPCRRAPEVAAARAREAALLDQFRPHSPAARISTASACRPSAPTAPSRDADGGRDRHAPDLLASRMARRSTCSATSAESACCGCIRTTCRWSRQAADQHARSATRICTRPFRHRKRLDDRRGRRRRCGWNSWPRPSPRDDPPAC